MTHPTAARDELGKVHRDPWKARTRTDQFSTTEVVLKVTIGRCRTKGKWCIRIFALNQALAWCTCLSHRSRYATALINRRPQRYVSWERMAQGDQGTRTRGFAHGHLPRWPCPWQTIRNGQGTGTEHGHVLLDFIPAPIHAGGLRYHGVAPLISQLANDGLIRAEAYLQSDVFASAVRFAHTEGIIPAPESSHAIHGALEARGSGRGRRGADDSLQPLWSRPFRHGGVRQLLRRQARGRRARRG